MLRNGFTLVELMIVIAVMALLASVVVLMAGGISNGPGETATRFAGRLVAARDEAILTGRPMSAWMTQSGYGFDQLRDGHWQRLDRKPFEGADWGGGTTANIGSAEGRSRIRFDSLGLPDQPLELKLSRDGRASIVRIAANGDVTAR